MIEQSASVLLTSTIPLVKVQSVAVIAATAKATNGVSAPPIRAQSAYHPAFIYICGTEHSDEDR